MRAPSSACALRYVAGLEPEGGGRLVRYTPATGAARTWTIADDLRFDDSGSITPARAGGVWLVAQRSMQRFDGEAFRESVDIGADVAAAVEAPDQSLWAATSDGAVVHVVGASTSRVSVPQLATESYIASIAVDTAGRVWCGWAIGSEEAVENEWVSRYDGSTWVTFDATAAAPLEGSIFSLTALPDGSVVAATSRGVARFDGSTWSDLTRDRPGAGAAGECGHDRAGRLPLDGLGGPDGRHRDGQAPRRRLVDAVRTRAGAAWPGTRDGESTARGDERRRVRGNRRRRLPDGGGLWHRAWPTAGTPVSDYLRSVAAASRDEAWAWSPESLWHFANGSRSAEPAPYPDDIGGLDGVLRSPDGTIWVTVSASNSGDGTGYRLQGGQWVRVAIAPSALGVDDSGSVWVAGYDAASPAGIVVRSYALDSDSWIERSSTTSTSLVSGHLTGVAVGGDGSVWLASSGNSAYMLPSKAAGAGLARNRLGSWGSVSLPGLPPDLVLRGLASTRDGSVWAIVPSTDGPSVVRFDGSGGGSSTRAMVSLARTASRLRPTAPSGRRRRRGSPASTAAPGRSRCADSVSEMSTSRPTGPCGSRATSGSRGWRRR